MSRNSAFIGIDSIAEIIPISHRLCDRRSVMANLHLPRLRLPILTRGHIRCLILAALLAFWAAIAWWVARG